MNLPEGEDINEWVAVNTVDFFNQVQTYTWRYLDYHQHRLAT